MIPNVGFYEILHWLVEIFVMTVIFFYILRILRGTRGLLMLGTVMALLGILWLVSYNFDLPVLQWFVEKAGSLLPLLIIVIFQQEIRRVLTMVQVSFQRASAKLTARSVAGDNVQTALLVPTLMRMSSAQVGGLIAIEQTVGLESWSVNGSILNAPLRQNQLLETIFHEGGPLHDGGVIIRGLEILAASCTFPLVEREDGNVVNGMRHQAALGLSEQCDAVIVVVSEETGRISVANNGHMEWMPDEERLRATLNRLLLPIKSEENKDLIDDVKIGLTHLSGYMRLLGRKMRKSGKTEKNTGSEGK